MHPREHPILRGSWLPVTQAAGQISTAGPTTMLGLVFKERAKVP